VPLAGCSGTGVLASTGGMTDAARALAQNLSPDLPVLITGPTASGKSALALGLAQRQGRSVVNADALQVFRGWPLLTAQPSAEDRNRAPHRLYGHLPHDADYSVGAWLRDVAPLLDQRPAPVIVGGTGLYLSALTEGLAEIPATETAVRERATDRLTSRGLAALVSDLDPQTRARIDTRNPMRVQRAWEVLEQTGRGLAAWQAETGPPLVPPDQAQVFQVIAPPESLTPRIAARFDAMMQQGALAEARAMWALWNPDFLSSRAIGAADLIAVLRGELTESQAAARAVIATRQYAKRQRTWFRRRMGHWPTLNAAAICDDFGQHTAKRP
jgi:tRNA dimethylallyltransferase